MVTLGLFARPAKSRYENNLSAYLQQIVDDNKLEDLQALKAKYLRQLTGDFPDFTRQLIWIKSHF